MKHTRGIGIVLGVVVVGAYAVSALATDPRQALCTAQVGAPVRAAFAMTRASDYRLHLPKMGYSPELEQGDPAYLVAFSGDITVSVVGAPPAADENGRAVSVTGSAPTTYSGVVCVVVGGEPIVYVNVDQTGLN